MWDTTIVDDLAQVALAALTARTSGLEYGDVRFVAHERRHAASVNGVTSSRESTSRGAGIRVLVRDSTGRGGWGFAATSQLDASGLEAAVAEALACAEANCGFQPEGTVTPVYPGSSERGRYATPVERCPFQVPLADLEARVTAVDEAYRGEDVITRECAIDAHRLDSLFVATSGAHLRQTLTRTGATSKVTVGRPGVPHHQTRSNPFGVYGSGGLELVDRFRMAEEAGRVADEARTILAAPPCPSGRSTVVIGPQMLALLVHEVAGHALELDRALGLEAAYAGRSFLTTDLLGKLRYGNELVTIVSDPTWPGGVSTYGWDDEGTPARAVPMVDRGLFVAYLSGRSDAPLVGLESSAACRATCWSRQPIDRMTNVNLLPGTGPTAEEIIAGVEDGLYLDVPCGWSINADRNGFRFSVEICRRIRGGRLGEWLRNGAFSSPTTPEFWARCRAVASDPPVTLGFSNCAKGQPVQIQYTGHVVPQVVCFDEVEVGEHGSME